jgi:hypothetical protein
MASSRTPRHPAGGKLFTQCETAQRWSFRLAIQERLIAPARLGADRDLFLAVFPAQFVPEWHLYRVPQSPQLALVPARSATTTSEPRE